MPSDDELRRVAEDVRALARSLARDIRAAVDRARDEMYGPGGPSAPGRRSAREDLAAAGRAARQELRDAQWAVRRSARGPRGPRGHHGPHGPGQGAGDGVEGRDDVDGVDRDVLGVDRDVLGVDRDVLGRLGAGCPPRWDNWGRGICQPIGVRTAVRERSGRPMWSRTGFEPPNRAQSPPAAVQVAALPLRHRHDGSTLLGLLAVVFGLAWLVAGTHLAHVSTEVVVAIALMVLGAATVVTARTDWALSRRSWPVVGGAALALALLAISGSHGLPVGFRHLEFGSRTITPTSWAEAPTTIHGGFGRTVVDLSGLPPLDEARTLWVDGAAGRLEINLPANLKVVLDARLVAGKIEVNGMPPTSGLHRVDNEILDASAAGPPLTLHVQSGFGSVAITQPVTPTSSGATPRSALPAPTPIAPSVPAPPMVPARPSVPRIVP